MHELDGEDELCFLDADDVRLGLFLKQNELLGILSGDALQ